MKTCRVLIMEDDPLIGMLVAELLEEMGYDVCAIAATAADGVTAAGQYRPDLVIADARLGDGSGISAIEEILRTGFVPHLFMTGNIPRVKALRPDAVVLEKPFRAAELMLAIQRALDIAAAPSRMEWA
jgi:two-component system, response regulator PdtaR